MDKNHFDEKDQSFFLSCILILTARKNIGITEAEVSMRYTKKKKKKKKKKKQAKIKGC